MTAKEYLQQLQRLDILIKQKNREADDLRLRSKSVASIDYSKGQKQTSSSEEAPFVKTLERIDELEAEISAEIDNYFAEKHKIINQIQSLQNVDHIRLLYKRYVEFKSLSNIGAEMHFSYDRVKHLHGYALQEFERKFQISKLSTK